MKDGDWWTGRMLKVALPLACAVAAALSLLSGSAFGDAFAPTTASFANGGVLVNGTRYAKAGDQLTLSVTTDSKANCVDVSGAFAGHQQTSTPKSTWTFQFTAPAGNGPQTVTVLASDK